MENERTDIDIIDEYIGLFKHKLRDLPFPYIIEVSTGCKVYALTEDDKEVIEELFKVSKDVVEWAKLQDFTGLRVNEISNRLEAELRVRLGGEIPEGKMAGYPNILIERGGKSYYIEVKLTDISRLNSRLRAFYYEPAELAKVKRDAWHILVGFIHKNKIVHGFKIVDLSKIKVALKNEFNADNRELYKNIVREFP